MRGRRDRSDPDAAQRRQSARVGAPCACAVTDPTPMPLAPPERARRRAMRVRRDRSDPDAAPAARARA